MSCKKWLNQAVHIRKHSVVVAFAVLAMTVFCLGPSQAADDLPQEPATTEPEAVTEPQAEDIGTGGTIQSLTLKKDMGIRDALRFLAARYQQNIVPSPNVEGQLAFSSLFNVTFEEAMAAILGDNFRYEQDGNLIKVYTRGEYKKIKEDKERMVHQVFTLFYISADEAKKLLTPVLSDAGSVQASTPAEKNISIGGTTSGAGSSISAGGGGGDSMAGNDMLLVHDYPENIARVEQLLKSIDVKPKQVLIEATILSARLTERTALGIDLNLLGGVSLTGETATQDIVYDTGYNRGGTASTPIEQIADFPNKSGALMETSGFAAAGANGLRIGIRSGNIAAFITALEGITDVTVLANPKILAVNKQEGSVLIGKKVGYRSQTTQTETMTTQKVEFLETGTRLVFRPFIGEGGYIRMDIYPKDSGATLNAQGIPDETTTELRTNIVVKDGQTIVIGGLFRESVNTGRSQVPLLGDLPIIGAAFRGSTDENNREEVIILLTPHIIEEPEQTQGEARAADVARKRYGARQNLQWVSRSRLAEDRYTRAVRYYADGYREQAVYELNAALELRPTYLEALRLKERIIRETSPDGAARVERIMLEVMDREEAPNWRRR